MGTLLLGNGRSGVRSKVWVLTIRVLEVNPEMDSVQRACAACAAGNDFMQVWTNLCYRECFCKTNAYYKNAPFAR